MPQSHQSQGFQLSNWAVRWVPYVAPIIPSTNIPGVSAIAVVIAIFGEKALILTQTQLVSWGFPVCHASLVAIRARQGVEVF